MPDHRYSVADAASRGRRPRRNRYIPDAASAQANGGEDLVIDGASPVVTVEPDDFPFDQLALPVRRQIEDGQDQNEDHDESSDDSKRRNFPSSMANPPEHGRILAAAPIERKASAGLIRAAEDAAGRSAAQTRDGAEPRALQASGRQVARAVREALMRVEE